MSCMLVLTAVALSDSASARTGTGTCVDILQSWKFKGNLKEITVSCIWTEIQGLHAVCLCCSTQSLHHQLGC